MIARCTAAGAKRGTNSPRLNSRGPIEAEARPKARDHLKLLGPATVTLTFSRDTWWRRCIEGADLQQVQRASGVEQRIGELDALQPPGSFEGAGTFRGMARRTSVHAEAHDTRSDGALQKPQQWGETFSATTSFQSADETR